MSRQRFNRHQIGNILGRLMQYVTALSLEEFDLYVKIIGGKNSIK